MPIYRLVVLSLLLLLLGASVAAQPVDLIGDQLFDVERGFFELGNLHVTPTIRFSGGYDSNALSTPDPQADIAGQVAPGLRLGLPVGSRAYLALFEEIDFVYYKEEVDLRQVFNVTHVGGGWGGRRYLLQVDNEFRAETRRPTTEFDFPVETRQNNFDASLTLALGWRHELRARYEQTRSRVLENALDDATIPERLNHVLDTVAFDFSRRLSSKTSAIVEMFYDKFDFEDQSRDSDSYGMRAGFDFSPRPRRLLVRGAEEPGVAGTFLLGYRKLAPRDGRLVEYDGPIGSVNLSYVSKDRHRLSGVYGRDIVPSILPQNWYFVEQRIGGSFRWQLHERFSVEPGVVVGSNDYPLPRVIERDGELVEENIDDEHFAYRLTLSFGVRRGWDVGVNAQYFDRRSDVLIFQKERLLLGFFMTLMP